MQGKMCACFCTHVAKLYGQMRANLPPPSSVLSIYTYAFHLCTLHEDDIVLIDENMNVLNG